MQIDFCISPVTLINSKQTKEFKYKIGIRANRSMQAITTDEKKAMNFKESEKAYTGEL